MKKFTIVILAMVFSVSSVVMTGCYGSFALTKKVYHWNGSFNNKFAKEAVFIALLILPVYELSPVIDGFFLNLIEFWTGKNPLSLNEGINKVNFDGKDFIIDLNKDVATIYDANNHELAKLNYDEANKTWYSEIQGQTRKLMTIGDDNVQLYTASGNVITVDQVELASPETCLKLNEFTAMK